MATPRGLTISKSSVKWNRVSNADTMGARPHQRKRATAMPTQPVSTEEMWVNADEATLEEYRTRIQTTLLVLAERKRVISESIGPRKKQRKR